MMSEWHLKGEGLGYVTTQGKRVDGITTRSVAMIKQAKVDMRSWKMAAIDWCRWYVALLLGKRKFLYIQVTVKVTKGLVIQFDCVE